MERIIKVQAVTGFFLVVTVLLAGTMARSSQQRESSDKVEPINVSMVALLSSPERYDGKLVRTIGFLRLEFEGNALYLHEEDYLHRITKNALELSLSKEQEERYKMLSTKYVLIEGTVSASRWEAETSISSGHIKDVTRLEYWPPPGDTPSPHPGRKAQ
ncbi:MAG TPA: hypothetical protein VJO35_13125 [Terriglobales bacterium]|nr:hypothetical protein [Terriglobales bacterium]